MAAMLCLLAAGIAFSLTVENISLERMSRESHAIVYGTVLSSYSQWEEKNIYTYTTVRVKESLKGNNGSTITVKQLGGTVGEIGQEVSGSPRLNREEDVVLFLTQSKGAFWIHSIVLGKFSIISENGRQVAFNDLNNIGLIDPVTKEEITQPNQKSNHIPLQNFLGEVRSFNTR
jgi:uncharacterized protein (UPF0333 family)